MHTPRMRSNTGANLAIWFTLALLLAGVAAPGLSPHPAAADSDPSINEFVFNHDGTDTSEYVEIFGAASTDLSAYTILQIEGDSGASQGTIDTAITVGTTDANGFWDSGLLNSEFENGTVTLLLVQGFTGAEGNDLDTDNDGTFDTTPWTSIVDSVAVDDGGAGDQTYEGTTGPALDESFDDAVYDSTFPPGGASRLPNDTDTEGAGDWVRNDFDLTAPTPQLGEALNTRGALNRVVTVLVINEIDYDQGGSDSAEFIEIKNTGGDPVNLDAYSVQIIDGSGGGATVVRTIDLPNIDLAAGDYYVICGDTATVANCDLDTTPDADFIEDGAPDAVALVQGDVVYDTVSYEGDTGSPYTEGSGAGLEDDVTSHSIARCTDGTDTNQNNNDFTATNITPGETNTCVSTCNQAATRIHAIQGDGAASPFLGQTRSITGVVVGDFQGSDELRGFFVQEADTLIDSDPATSEGIFVYAPGALNVNAGDVVSVTGQVAEYFTLTELTSITGIEVCPTSATASASTVALPETTDGDLERYEGMFVELPDMTIAQNYFLGRYGQMTLSACGRLYQPTNQFLPGSADALELADTNARCSLVLDDGQDINRFGDNPDPVPYLGPPPPAVIRAGDTVSNLIGVLDYGRINFNADEAATARDYRLHPTVAPVFTAVNTRPTEPEEVGGSLRVASFNVLNYFTSIDDGTDKCGPPDNLQECRGADSDSEFLRQRTKIITAMLELDADIIGLMELENNYAAGADSAIQDLVNGLNENAPAGTSYAYIDPGVDYIGTDAIAVGLIYNTATVAPIGAAAILDSSVDPDFNDERNRPALLQTFSEIATGEQINVVVNHFKSKGSDCGGAPDDDPVQGNCNGTRTEAANALVAWLATDPTGNGDPDILIIGDLNSYAQEDPITAIESLGYTNLIRAFAGSEAYSYIFDGLSGYLDHALANTSLLPQVTGATEWHINTDEPAVIDYDEDFNPAGYYSPDAYRSSDHDPVVVGLNPGAVVVASSDTYTVTEDSAPVSLNVLQNDIGGTLNITSVGATSSGGSAQISDTERITYAPAADFFGIETFTYTVAISGTSQPVSTATVAVTVTAVNDAPTLDSPDDLTLGPGAGEQTVNLSGITAGAANETQTITITATSDNTALIADPVVTYTSPDATGSLSFTPTAEQVGVATISVTVQDSGGTASGGEDTTTVTFVVNITQSGTNTLPHGVAAGDVTTATAVLWTRSTVLGTVTFEYSTDETFATGTQTADASVTDPLVPVKVLIEGLTPDTQYYYRATDANSSVAQGTFRTAAEVGTLTGLRFGVTGDWQEPPPYPALKNADERDLDFFVQHSDNIYADISTPAVPVEQATTLEQFRTKYTEVYSTVQNVNTMRDLRSSTAIMAIIDDHELTDNFAGGAPPAQGSNTKADVFAGSDAAFTNDTQIYEDAMQVFQEYNPLREEFYEETGSDPRMDGERKLYRYQTYGSDAAVFIADPRSFRDAQLPAVASITDTVQVTAFISATFTPGRTMLGERQLEMLQEDLQQAQDNGITWKFVFISEPTQNFGAINAEDRFEGYAAERTALLEYIDQHNITNVVFVAADVHGTVVNNLTYQLAAGQPHQPTGAFEVIVGPAAFFDGLFGSVVAELAFQAGFLSPQAKAFYDAQDQAGKDAVIKQVIDGLLTTGGYDTVGLDGSEIDATLIAGDYVRVHKYGWTEFAIDETTQQLTVTTYGIEPYSYDQFLDDPATIISEDPIIVSQFVVDPAASDSGSTIYLPLVIRN